MTTQLRSPVELLGKVIDSSESLRYLTSFDPKPKVKRANGKKLWSSKTAGFETTAEQTADRVTTVFLHGEGHEGFHQYVGPVPHDITFNMTRDQIRKTMKSPPDGSDEGEEIYDTWDLADHRFIVEYDKIGRVRLICITGDF